MVFNFFFLVRKRVKSVELVLLCTFQTILSAFCLWETAVDSELAVSVSAFWLISLLFKQLIQLTLPSVQGSFARRCH